MRPLETAQENVRRLSNNNTIVLPYPEHCPTKEWKDQFVECTECQIQYCSEDCRVEAFRKYHMTCCLGAFKDDDTHPVNILNETWKKMHYPPESGTIMLIVRLMAMFKQSKNKEEFLETLRSFQSIIVNEEQQICHKMLGTQFETQFKKLYEAFHKAFQSKEFEMFLTKEAFTSLMALIGTNAQGIATSPFGEWVRKVTSLNLSLDIQKEVDDFIDDIYSKLSDFAGDFLNNEGSGLYEIQSKINHSCIPNAQSSFPYSNDILVLKAIKHIQSGEEICVSYLDECQLMRSRHSRQKILKDNYLFICKCPKCIEQSSDLSETSDEEDENDSLYENDDVEMNKERYEDDMNE
ncbi:histone-lysine N-trimethyltransferase SMYD5 isoform X2 [Condylostylus longicornis]|nr:histone-lysine N-trimethyltransferase SMYD5 isoform X2 [Condylostylus longicornis]